MAGQAVGCVFDRNKLNRYNACALVQHLKVSMLPIGARFAPQHRGSVKRQRLALQVNPFAIAFHFKLLQVRWQAPQRVAVRRNAAAGKAMKVAIPNVKQAQARWQVLLKGCVAKVLVHRMRPTQKFKKSFSTDCHRNRQPNC